MFVCSMKMNPKTALAIAACVVALVLLLVLSCSQKNTAQPTASKVSGADDASRTAFLTSLGYEVSAEHTAVREVQIPDAFDETFTAYNELQKAAGTDLEAYAGRRVKCWTYTVDNYPSAEPVQAHIYTFENAIIGGDIASTAQDGFMHGLLKLDKQQAFNGTTATATKMGSAATVTTQKAG